MRRILIALGVSLLLMTTALLAAAASTEDIIAAARSGDEEAVERLLDADKDAVYQRDTRFGGTPLHWAAMAGHADVARLLLEHGAEVNARNDDRRTPLHLAAAWGQREVAGILLEHGAAWATRDRDGMNALQLADSYFQPVIAGMIRNAAMTGGRRVTARSMREMPPLHALALPTAIGNPAPIVPTPPIDGADLDAVLAEQYAAMEEAVMAHDAPRYAAFFLGQRSIGGVSIIDGYDPGTGNDFLAWTGGQEFVPVTMTRKYLERYNWASVTDIQSIRYTVDRATPITSWRVSVPVVETQTRADGTQYIFRYTDIWEREHRKWVIRIRIQERVDKGMVIQ